MILVNFSATLFNIETGKKRKIEDLYRIDCMSVKKVFDKEYIKLCDIYYRHFIKSLIDNKKYDNEVILFVSVYHDHREV